jgi:hypothetical protein
MAVIILAVFFFLHNAAEEKRRRGEARRLFLKAQSFQTLKQYDEAYEVLYFIRWTLVDREWFEKFIATDKIVTRKKFLNLNKFLLVKIKENVG